MDSTSTTSSDLAALLTRIRDSARAAAPDHAEKIVVTLGRRLADGSLGEATPGMTTAHAQAVDDLTRGRSITALLGIAYHASIELEVNGAGS